MLFHCLHCQFHVKNAKRDPNALLKDNHQNRENGFNSKNILKI